MWHDRSDKPESGRRIVALFSDGSGATLFWVHDHGLMDQDGEDREILGKNYERWAYLPDDYRTWIEDNLE
jgi:hypothetical protein